MGAGGNRNYFNPHFREGSDPAQICDIPLFQYFNPHFREGSDVDNALKTAINDNFNPHFREGSDTAIMEVNKCTEISIHTSAKEVTAVVINEGLKVFISIHTSAKEVTCAVRRIGSMVPYFNPHFREGSDYHLTVQRNRMRYFNPHFREGSDPISWSDSSFTCISIHTSAKEVTCCL